MYHHLQKIKHAPAIDFIGAGLMFSSLVYAYYDDDIVSLSRFTLHFPVLVSFFLIFRRHITLLQAGIVSWIAFILFYFDFVEGFSHKLFLEMGVFDLLKFHGAFVPTVAIFIYYFIALSILGMIIIRKKFRTPLRTFSFLSSLGTCVVTMALHEAIPKTTFPWEQEMIEKVLVSLVKSTSPQDLPKVCKEFNLVCYLGVRPEAISSLTQNAYLNSRLNNLVSRNDSLKTFRQFTKTGEGEGLREIYLMRINSNQSVDILVENVLADKSEEINEIAFSRILSFAVIVWGWLFLIIGVLHTKPIRKEVWVTD